METTVNTMDSLIANVSTVGGAVIDWVGDIGTAVMNTPVLAITVCAGIFGIGIGWFKSLRHS